MMTRELTLITDYRQAFYSRHSNRRTFCSMSLNALEASFRSMGVSICRTMFRDIDLSETWAGRVVIYQSSEDPNLDYRSFIEDMALGLKLAGAVLIPDFHFLRAHHNKVFFENLRKTSRCRAINNLRSRVFGTLEECDMDELDYPLVIKPAAGAASRDVCLATARHCASRHIKRISRSHDGVFSAKEGFKRLLLREYTPYSLHRRKFVCQQFIPGLHCDYKVLVFGRRYYVLQRDVRPNDFRASGSGRFVWPSSDSSGILTYARTIVEAFDVPFASLDIAVGTDEKYLLEGQFLCFGTLTVEAAPHHWTYSETMGFEKVLGTPSPEEALAEAVTDHCERHGLWPNGH